MKKISIRHCFFVLMLVSLGCSGPIGLAQSSSSAQAAANSSAALAAGIGQIQHVVFIVKENRSFNEYFGTFPGATGSTTGLLSTGATIPLVQTPDAMPNDICHDWQCLIAMMDYGKMDHYDLERTCTINGILLCFSQHTQAT